MDKITAKEIEERLAENTARYFGKTPQEVSKNQLYQAVCTVVKDILTNRRLVFKRQVREEEQKRVYYMSMEFLLGRSLKNHLANMEMTDVFAKVVKKLGYELDDLCELEPDAGLGNGGLGRLAAAYMESLTSLGYVASGFSIRYDYGIFKQKIVDGWQIEMPDEWLKNGSVWLAPRPEDTFDVRLGGIVKQHWDNGKLRIEHTGYTTIKAVPYDMNISGYNDFAVNKLRLWSAEARNAFDMKLFSQGEYLKAMEEKAMAESISKVLYPADDNYEGKSLRLKQQYFFVSASMQYIVNRHLKAYKTLDNLADKVAIHINDTHPTLCIPELMRILVDEYDYDWNKAWDIVTHATSYTNHTVMSEALEKWPISLFKTLLPRIYQIIEEINRRYCEVLWQHFSNDNEKVASNAILSYEQIKMANLCLAASHKINGVSMLHSEILKKDVFKDYYAIAPEKFTNVTNGITHRRWLKVANPRLTSLITELIGDGFITKSEELEKLLKYQGDKKVLNELAKIKLANKKDLADFIYRQNGVTVNPNAIFDVQVKRLHEYKRQLLNVLNIMDTYYMLKDNPNMDIVPKVYIFSAKAASSYYMAKQIIRLIVMLGEVINNDKTINDKLKVVFLENYSVSLAERIMPASEVSEQISVAGKEASGTGNMKFMINGAVTIGTMDGANVEIAEAVGEENMFIFGLLTEQVNKLYKEGYNPTKYYNESAGLKRVIAELRNGVNNTSFNEIADYLLFKDPYLCLADFESYKNRQNDLSKTYLDKEKFQRMSLINIAKEGFFSSDRAVKEYADRIWNLTPVIEKKKK
ncbi:MAG: glycogen/starch/alpha-glucan phosphorylase [Eubacteriales bacterium]|nr:glycogen/starch/alpha-glucan phosphorylase [Eubacteriales bacterium]